MPKSTPLEQLPNSSNMQMNQDIGQMNSDMNPNMNQMNPDMNQDIGQMNPDMNSNMEYQKDMQDHFIKRQFIPQSGMKPPTNEYYDQSQEVYPPTSSTLSMSPMLNVKTDKSIFQIIKENSKMLAILFALLMIVQMETVQSIIRTAVRMTKIPDNMVFIVSKVLTSVLGVILFFIIYRNF